MTQITDKTTAMPLPEGAERVYYDGVNSIGFYLNGELRFIHLPPGSWRFLFTTKTATEEDARKAVAWIEIAGKIGYYDYTHPERYRYLASWEDSLRSFLVYNELDDNKNYALIEKESNDEVVS